MLQSTVAGAALRLPQQPPPSAAHLRAASAADGARLRRSRWEPPALPPSGGNHVPTLGSTIFRPGAASWVRSGGTTQVGGNQPMRHSRGPSVGSYPLHTPLNSLVGTVDSRIGAFSPPRMVGALYVAGHGGAPVYGTSDQGDDRSQNQSSTSCGSSLLDHQEGMGRNDGQLDGQAMALASKAPRGP